LRRPNFQEASVAARRGEMIVNSRANEGDDQADEDE